MRGGSTATEWGHSRWEMLEKCPRAYHYAYDLGIRSTSSSDAAAVGTVVHRALAAYYDPSEAVEPTLAMARGPEALHVKAEAKRLFEAYRRYWGDHADWRREDLVATEKHVSLVIQSRGKEVKFTTRLDLVVKDAQGRHVLVDHKTSSRNSGDFMLEWMASAQFKGSVAAWPYANRGDAIPVTLNRIIKTAVPTFDRQTFVVTPSDVKRWVRDLIALDSDRRRYKRSGYWPRHRSSCIGRYGPCSFYNLCHGAGAGAANEFTVPKGVDLKEAIK
jgi:hypothetical protein